ncbi:MAG: hypothetical protein A2Z29_04990 [Chloroflexi bacterium RBG_16_56_11]|nr:MAG: hypothetical protein A2Z29_04990 [Chloroflexi bacterium RBG_16_56_11]
MIPVRLKMRNFMCYRDDVPPLDFTGIHLACICGDNGNGKTAIIDAMTWALWGKARAGSDDDLIHATQSEMEVEFDFTVSQQLYRIIRKRSRPKKRTGPGQSSLDLLVAGTDGFKVVTGNSIAQTESKIIDVLHMDYDTFINSAYLRQGHADEFTRQPPSRRKEVLGNILGLGRYEQLEDKARELARRREIDKARLENAIREIGEEIGRKPALDLELQKAQATLAHLDAVAQEKEIALNRLRQQKEALEIKKTHLDELLSQIGNINRDLETWAEQADRHSSVVKKYEEIIVRQAEIESGYQQLEEAKKALDEFDRRFRQSIAMERQKDQLERRIEQRRNELLQEHAVLRSKINELEQKMMRLPEFKDQLNRAQLEVRRLPESEAMLARKDEDIREIQRQVSFTEAEIGRLEREISELAEKLDLLESHNDGHDQAKCPLCERELTPETRQLIESKYSGEKQESSVLLESKKAGWEKKRLELAAMQKEKSQMESDLDREKTRVRSQEELFKTKIKEIEADGLKILELKESLAGIEGILAGKDFFGAEHAALANIEAGLNQLGYDAEKHEQVRQRLTGLEPYERQKNSLDEATRLIGPEKESAARAEKAAAETRERLKDSQRKKESLSAELIGLPDVRRELAASEFEYRELTAQRSQSQEAVGSVKARLQRVAEMETKQREKESELGVVAREESVYRELARAFGKTGIQALLIEMALPEIENEANNLLARMTDNRMHAKFETQKETKRGTVQETLNIAIADELGTRDYEMFSGGEAFRINFAIRIALSRLLARRAGAPLPTLIIDEGFGTQDSAALEKVKEAIISIQGDFEKILVITHMEELKDAFPNRIDVVKTPQGSTITVS